MNPTLDAETYFRMLAGEWIWTEIIWIRRSLQKRNKTRTWNHQQHNRHPGPERRRDYETMIVCCECMRDVKLGRATVREAATRMRHRGVSLHSALRMLAVRRHTTTGKLTS